MSNKLTKSQKSLMTKAMRAGNAAVAGAAYRVATNLSEKGYGELSYTTFTPTREGLQALLYDRKIEDCRQASMASMGYVDEVEAALSVGENCNG